MTPNIFQLEINFHFLLLMVQSGGKGMNPTILPQAIGYRVPVA